MSKLNNSFDQTIIGVKEIILKIVNADLDEPLEISDINDEDDIATSTLMKMDSIKAIKMVVEIERKFGISVPDEDLDMNNFKNAAAITTYILMKKSSAGEN